MLLKTYFIFSLMLTLLKLFTVHTRAPYLNERIIAFQQYEELRIDILTLTWS